VSPSPHKKTERDQISEALCFLFILNSGRSTGSINSVILSLNILVF
jgi:hypothetical protein